MGKYENRSGHILSSHAEEDIAPPPPQKWSLQTTTEHLFQKHFKHLTRNKKYVTNNILNTIKEKLSREK